MTRRMTDEDRLALRCEVISVFDKWNDGLGFDTGDVGWLVAWVGMIFMVFGEMASLPPGEKLKGPPTGEQIREFLIREVPSLVQAVVKELDPTTAPRYRLRKDRNARN